MGTYQKTAKTPYFIGVLAVYRSAEKGTWTLDPFITSEVLYRLSYFSTMKTQVLSQLIIIYAINNFVNVFLLCSQNKRMNENIWLFLMKTVRSC